MLVHEDRLFPADPSSRAIARSLYASVKDLPIVSPHGHTDPRWFADNEAFPDPATLFVVPDHYVSRMLYSQGIRLEDLGIATKGAVSSADPRAIWRLFAANYHLFRGTPTRTWLDHTFATLFGFDERLSGDECGRLLRPYRCGFADPGVPAPRALRAVRHRGDRHHREPARSLEAPRDSAAIGLERAESSRLIGPTRSSTRNSRVSAKICVRFGELTDCDTATWDGYLEAHRKRRAFFRQYGATSTDHGHPSALTADLPKAEAEALYRRVSTGVASAADAELFRAQMLTEMAAMSVEDGMVMQIHPGSFRNHNADLFRTFGRDMGGDIPTRTDYVRALKPMLDRFGNDPTLRIILFTLDETSYSRELAPLAGHYPALKLGPAWWFFDAPEGMRRFRELTTETAGFYNTVGFNDDTRAYLSIPARHDMARRVDCAYLAGLVTSHRLEEDEAHEVAYDLAYRLAKEAYKL